MAELLRDQRRFGWPHQQNGERYGHHRPEHGVHPERRLEAEFHPEGQPHHNRAQHQDDAHRRTITRIVFAQVETADVATFAYLKQAAKQPALPATRATTGQGDVQQRWRRLRHAPQWAAMFPAPHQ